MSIAIGYGGYDGPYNVTFQHFTDETLPRVYDSSGDFSVGLSGQQLLVGRGTRARYIWNISARITEAEALVLDNLFRSWDDARSRGIPAAVGIIDETGFLRVTGDAIFTVSPEYARSGPGHYVVTFALTEV